MALSRILVFLFFYLFFINTRARSIIQRPQPSFSFKINSTSENYGSCSFTVMIRTSCYSTSYTRDQISLSFGDAYGNQVYAPRLDDPGSRAFKPCSTDTYTLYGPCTYQICYLYLYRSGYDGWMPYDVSVYGPNSSPVSFYFNVFIPSGTWYGFNYCGRRGNADAASVAAA
ncbi:hypothetical protein LIER_19980 [Lithospermum erythrorhizon]|uniref:Uncharacterized protein n=1 Tax=Lithospermum erythrorhizon TaxID=34254 RepID=A0AAV3QJQ2_LITER